jgi:hypothetical protein
LNQGWILSSTGVYYYINKFDKYNPSSINKTQQPKISAKPSCVLRSQANRNLDPGPSKPKLGWTDLYLLVAFFESAVELLYIYIYINIMPLPIINLIQPKKLNLHVFYQRAQKIGSNYQVTTHWVKLSSNNPYHSHFCHWVFSRNTWWGIMSLISRVRHLGIMIPTVCLLQRRWI